MSCSQSFIYLEHKVNQKVYNQVKQKLEKASCSPLRNHGYVGQSLRIEHKVGIVLGFGLMEHTFFFKQQVCNLDTDMINHPPILVWHPVNQNPLRTMFL